jgi:hypothetical protein
VKNVGTIFSLAVSQNCIASFAIAIAPSSTSSRKATTRLGKTWLSCFNITVSAIPVGFRPSYAEVAEAADAAFYTAAKLAKIMNSKEAERTMLGIRTIGAVDVSPEQRKANRKKRDRDRRARQRRDAKKPTRAEYLAANAKSREKPWLAEGISRRTWYRRQMAQVVPPYKNRDSYNTADAPVPRQAVSGKRKPSSATPNINPIRHAERLGTN